MTRARPHPCRGRVKLASKANCLPLVIIVGRRYHPILGLSSRRGSPAAGPQSRFIVPQIATWWAEMPCGSPVLRATFHRNRLEHEAPTLANSSMPNNEMTLSSPAKGPRDSPDETPRRWEKAATLPGSGTGAVLSRRLPWHPGGLVSRPETRRCRCGCCGMDRSWRC